MQSNQKIKIITRKNSNKEHYALDKIEILIKN